MVAAQASGLSQLPVAGALRCDDSRSESLSWLPWPTVGHVTVLPRDCPGLHATAIIRYRDVADMRQARRPVDMLRVTTVVS